jgi:polyketide biosynthesis enoyl-CoA hydratase PksI
LVGQLREELPQVIQQEAIMQEKTFHNPDVKDRINILIWEKVRQQPIN